MTVGWPFWTFGNLKLGNFSTNVPCPPLPPCVFGRAVTGVMTRSPCPRNTQGGGGELSQNLKIEIFFES